MNNLTKLACLLLVCSVASGQVTNPTAAGGGGSVTSVGLSAPTGFTISGSPVTGAGTLGFTYTAHAIALPLACEAASASGTAYTCTTSPSFTPADGDAVLFESDVANTGSATLAVNGAAAGVIKKLGGTANLAANDIAAGKWTFVIFEATAGVWQMLSAADVVGVCTACVVTNASNAWTTGTQDFTGATATKVSTVAAGDSTTNAASTAFVTTAVNNAIAAVNPAVAVQAASAAVLPNSPTYSNGVAGIGATLTTATTNTPLVVDGYTPVLNDRILVKNQASAFQNGVYIVTQVSGVALAWILTRALDYDQPSDMNNTGAIPVVNGTANTQTQWLQTSLVGTVGTDAVTFIQFTLAPNTLVTASSPGVGIAHFPGSSQNVTSSAVDLSGADVTGTLAAAREPAHTGNVTNSAGSLALTIGASQVTEAMQVLADNTTNNVSTSAHGYAPKAPNDVTKFLDGTGVYSVPVAPASAWFSPAWAQTVAETATTQNITKVWGFSLGFAVTNSAICYDSATADNTANVYDIGVYDSTGALKAHTGAVAGTTLFPSTGMKCANWTGGVVTLAPGFYALGLTSSAATPLAAFGGLQSAAQAQFISAVTATGGTTSGGVLNNSITFPTATWASSGQTVNFALHN